MKRITFTIFLSFMMLFSFGQSVETVTGQIAGSGGVTVDKFGNVFVADFGIQLSNANGTLVYKITPDGTIDTFATGLSGASGNVLDGQGNLYQSNISGGFISKISANGTVSTFSSTGISAPVGLEFDTNGNLFVCNCGNNTIRKITPNGTSTLHSSSPLLSCPNGITRGENDTMYVSNFNNGFVLKIAPDGGTTVFALISGGRNGHIEYANNRFYVASHGSHQIHVVEPDGTISLLAGTGVRGNTDGTALSATISVPNGIGASPTGDTLYFNCTIPSTTYPNTINPSELRRLTNVHITTANRSIYINENNSLEISPNPTTDFVRLDFEIEKKQMVSLKIISLDGKEIINQSLGQIQGEFHEQYNLNDVPSGVYLVSLIGERFGINRRLVIQ